MIRTGTLILAALLTTAAAPTPRDGAHDFDPYIGRWQEHTRRLANPLSGQPARWVDIRGVTTVERIWGGKGNIALLDGEGPSGRFQLLALRLYDPAARQWRLTFATSGVGQPSVPMVGRFENGLGEFYDQEPFDGRMIWVRFRIWQPSKDSAVTEQAFSDDNGRTWETNFVNTYARLK